MPRVYGVMDPECYEIMFFPEDDFHNYFVTIRNACSKNPEYKEDFYSLDTIMQSYAVRHYRSNGRLLGTYNEPMEVLGIYVLIDEEQYKKYSDKHR